MPLPVPDTLWFVRHGESAANVIRLAALHSNVDELDDGATVTAEPNVSAAVSAG